MSNKNKNNRKTEQQPAPVANPQALQVAAPVVQPAPAETVPEELYDYEGEKLTKAQIEERASQMQAKLKALKGLTKPEAKKKELKGDLIRFKNSKGEVVEGKGVLYYVVRVGKKLVYKVASECEKVEAPAPETAPA